ncbi:transcriptional regulator, TraR/DksA family [Modestobacter sp. DSM 44400]|uniref:TraR/DksA family transcriptional regulator n=1 Tax=Modestobacter sp. DSM 44400 TaxID=1550230 RepID=UPI00089B3E38|nr:TraR/DksA C4-type zinc finger protein [Modestobacter sp. DSM 44400]SDY13977.1 transcriptional regulator, TraR/DksA family [Modestobacter sp. DSM 44400]
MTFAAPSELIRVRADSLAQIDALTREFDEVVAASKSSNADDEHDPEGATIAFERQQVAALLDQARARLADVDAALARADAGDYGRCADCGQPIAAERLAARPQAPKCIACAAAPARRR